MEISFYPRGCLIGLSLSFSYIVLYCFQRLIFSQIRLCYWFHHLSCHAPTGVFYPRGCLIGLSLSFSYIVLYCFQRLIFSQIRLCYWFHHLSCHAPTGVYFFRCNHLMACLLSSASTAHYVYAFALRGEQYTSHRMSFWLTFLYFGFQLSGVSWYRN